MSDALKQAAQKELMRRAAKAEIERRSQSQPYEKMRDVGDGSIYRMSDGSLSFTSPGYSTSDQATIEKMMEGTPTTESVAQQQAGTTLAMNPSMGAGGAAATYLKGTPFVGSYADEVVGAAMGGDKRDQFNQMQQTFETANPKTAMGIGLTSGLVSGGAMAAAALPALPSIASTAPSSLAGKVAYGTGLGSIAGATEGGIYGYGEGDGAERRVNSQQGAMIGGALGAGLGATAPLAGAAISKGSEKVLDALNSRNIRKQMGLQKPSADILTRAMSADDAFSGDGLQRIVDGGEDAMVVDSGMSARSLLDTAMQQGGPSANTARDAIEQRASLANNRIMQSLDQHLGKPQGLKGSAEEIASQSSAQRKAAYDAAYNSPIDYSGPGMQVETVMGRIPNSVKGSAIARANERMQINGVKNHQIMADIADDGSITFREMPNVQQLDELKRAMNEIASEEVDQFGRATGRGLDYSRLANDLRDSVKDAVPEYGNALKLGGDKIAEDNALRLGRDMFKPSTTREDVMRATQRFGDAETTAAKTGVRAVFDEALSNVKRSIGDSNMDAREASSALKSLSSRNAREKIVALLGDQPAGQMLSDIDGAASALDLRAGVSQNSKTFARQIMNDSVQSAIDGGPIRALSKGEPVNATKRLLQAMTKNAPEDRQLVADKIYSEIAGALTEPRGKDAQVAIKKLAELMMNKTNNAAAGQRLSRPATAALALPSYQLGQQQLNKSR